MASIHQAIVLEVSSEPPVLWNRVYEVRNGQAAFMVMRITNYMVPATQERSFDESLFLSASRIIVAPRLS
jgi:hypothetical protein